MGLGFGAMFISERGVFKQEVKESNKSFLVLVNKLFIYELLFLVDIRKKVQDLIAARIKSLVICNVWESKTSLLYHLIYRNIVTMFCQWKLLDCP